ALFEVDLKKQLYSHFENAERIFGVSSEILLDDTRAFSTLPYDDFVIAVTTYFFHPDDHAIALNAMSELLTTKTASYEARLRRHDNSYIWARIDLSLIMDEFGVPNFLVGYMTDIDDIKQQTELLKSETQIDSMTGIYNKVTTTYLSNAIIKETKQFKHALIILDIDNFKGINDNLGHAFGDIVLIDVATKLKTLFQPDDVVGRMGGDEFAIFIKSIEDTNMLLKKAAQLSSVFRQTYVGEKVDYKITCSMGIVLIENDKESFDALYRKADSALYKAKENGRDQFVLYQEKDADTYPIEWSRTHDEELQSLKSFHNIEEHIFELLYSAKDFNANINMALASIGQQYHVSRVAIYENDEIGANTTNIFEWCNDGISSEMHNFQNIPLYSGDESIYDSFDKNGLLYCNDARELKPYFRSLMESKGILSCLQVTVSNEDKTYGFIGFDECNDYRIWTAEEIEKLSYLSKMLSIFLFKKKTEDNLIANLNTRLKILDTLPDYICVVNPDTHSIAYSNNQMRRLIPDVTPGAFCFSKLRGGQEGPCETCLVERIKKGDVDNLEIVNEDTSLHLKIKALTINWTNDQKMVLLYGSKKNEEIL
ncbi:MAG: diguanylate cyclase, partial [Clostridia bacterium]